MSPLGLALAMAQLPAWAQGLPLAQVARALVVLLACVVAARFARTTLSRLLGRRNVTPELVILVRESIYVSLLVLGLFLFFAIALDLQFLALTGVLGAVLLAGLGIQDIVKNYVSGFYLLVERNIRVGDRIEFDGKSGIVTDVRLRVTYLAGEEGDVVIVPNATLFTSAVVRHGPAPGEAATPARPAPPGRGRRSRPLPGPTPPSEAS